MKSTETRRKSEDLQGFPRGFIKDLTRIQRNPRTPYQNKLIKRSEIR